VLALLSFWSLLAPFGAFKVGRKFGCESHGDSDERATVHTVMYQCNCMVTFTDLVFNRFTPQHVYTRHYSTILRFLFCHCSTSHAPAATKPSLNESCCGALNSRLVSAAAYRSMTSDASEPLSQSLRALISPSKLTWSSYRTPSALTWCSQA
jgi:hypothetical protein